jgi:hypothetical protein
LRSLAHPSAQDDDAAFRNGLSAILRPFLATLEDDAGKPRTGLQLALTQRAIGSQLVDNLNASMHLRALLTDLFLVDEAIGSMGA